MDLFVVVPIFIGVVWTIVIIGNIQRHREKLNKCRNFPVDAPLINALVKEGKISEQGGQIIKAKRAKPGRAMQTYARAYSRKQKAVDSGMSEESAIALAVYCVALSSISGSQMAVFADEFPEFSGDVDIFKASFDDSSFMSDDSSSFISDDSSTSMFEDSFSSSDDLFSDSGSMGSTINPATGLPMMDDGIGGIDVGGSPFGMDIHDSGIGMDDTFGTGMGMDDTFGTGMDDSFGSGMDDSFSSSDSFGSDSFGSDF